ALKSTDPDTKPAAVDVVETITGTLTPDEITKLSKAEIDSAVHNRTEEKKAEAAEAESGEVSSTEVPAGTDLLEKSESTALKTANEKLSVKPKVVTPQEYTEEETTELASKLAESLNNLSADSEVNAGLLTAAKENLKSASELEIASADKELDRQAEKLEEMLNKVGSALSKVVNGSGGKGVVLSTVLPAMTPSVSGFFPLKVNLRNLTPGRGIRFWPSVEYFLQQSARGEAQVSAVVVTAGGGVEGEAFFLDSEGKPVTKVSGDASAMSMVVYLEGGRSYDSAFITADASPRDQEVLEQLADDLSGTPTSNKGGGGCSGGFAGISGLLALAFVPAALRRRVRK
ncbi:MAG: hypothetical protein K6E38_02480, partial [Fretibacterium sp.]|nr:hypothetical protein [Fretibacterium sp.]